MRCANITKRGSDHINFASPGIRGRSLDAVRGSSDYVAMEQATPNETRDERRRNEAVRRFVADWSGADMWEGTMFVRTPRGWVQCVEIERAIVADFEPEVTFKPNIKTKGIRT